MYTHKNDTDLQKFIEDTYSQDKKLITKSFDEIDIELYEINEKLRAKEIKINEDNNCSMLISEDDIKAEIDYKLNSLDNNIQGKIEYYNNNNKTEHKKLKKLVKLAVLSKFI